MRIGVYPLPATNSGLGRAGTTRTIASGARTAWPLGERFVASRARRTGLVAEAAFGPVGTGAIGRRATRVGTLGAIGTVTIGTRRVGAFVTFRAR